MLFAITAPGCQVYPAAPDTVSVAQAPLQMAVLAVVLSVGLGTAVMVMLRSCKQPNELLPVTE
jgi:hypothetical protein